MANTGEQLQQAGFQLMNADMLKGTVLEFETGKEFSEAYNIGVSAMRANPVADPFAAIAVNAQWIERSKRSAPTTATAWVAALYGAVTELRLRELGVTEDV